jgi:hypothetical protein
MKKLFLLTVFFLLTTIVILGNLLTLSNEFLKVKIGDVDSKNAGFINEISYKDYEYSMISEHYFFITGNDLEVTNVDVHFNEIIVYASSPNFKTVTFYTLDNNNLVIKTHITNISDSAQLMRFSEVIDYNDRFIDFVSTRVNRDLAFVLQDQTFALGYFEGEKNNFFRLITNENRLFAAPPNTRLNVEETMVYYRYIRLDKNINDLQKYYFDKNNIAYNEYSGKVLLNNGKKASEMKVSLLDYTGQVEHSLKYTDENGNFTFYMPEGEYFYKVNFGNLISESTQEKIMYVDVEDNYFYYNQFLTNRTENGLTINFRTQIPAYSKVYVFDSKTGKKYEYKSLNSTDYHHIKIADLIPGRNYNYIIHVEDTYTNNKLISNIHSFKTKDMNENNFSFVVYNDSQLHDIRHTYVVKRIKEQYNPHFILRPGDLVEHGHNESQWREHFISAYPLTSNIPIYPALGNHEYNNELYYKAFDLPRGGGDYYKRWYSFEYGNSLFISLDSNIVEANALYNRQLTWLEDTLKNNADKEHIFVFFHHPFWTSSAEYGSMIENNPEGHANTKNWYPVFKEYGVKVVFNGHIHLYERYVKDDIQFITFGGGGAKLNQVIGVEPLEWQEEYILGYMGYTHVEILDGEIFITVHGVAMDTDPRYPERFVGADVILDQFVISPVLK